MAPPPYQKLLQQYCRGPSSANSAYVVLIGGGASTGKSTLAWELAWMLGIRNVISTDALRQAIRAVRPHDAVLGAETWDAWRTLGLRRSDRALLRGLNAQATALEEVWRPMIRYFLSKGMTTILEGIHILPTRTVCAMARAERGVVFFVDASDEQLRRNYVRRKSSTHMRSAEQGFQNVSDRVVLHRLIVSQARKAELPVITGRNWTTLVDRATGLVTGRLARP